MKEPLAFFTNLLWAACAALIAGYLVFQLLRLIGNGLGMPLY